VGRYVREKQVAGRIDPLVRQEDMEQVVLGVRGAPIEVWRSRHFLLQIFRTPYGSLRLTINRVERSGYSWEEGISWDDLQRLKGECGRGDVWAVECYPPEDRVVCVANMRHLWLLPEAPPYGW
jgi:hypothetical protein